MTTKQPVINIDDLCADLASDPAYQAKLAELAADPKAVDRLLFGDFVSTKGKFLIIDEAHFFDGKPSRSMSKTVDIMGDAVTHMHSYEAGLYVQQTGRALRPKGLLRKRHRPSRGYARHIRRQKAGQS